MFYQPLKLTHPKTQAPVFVYFEEGIENLVPRDQPGMLDEYLQQLYQTNNDAISRGSYQILFIWNFQDVIMADAWVFELSENWSLTSDVDVVNFQYLEISISGGVASGDGLILLGNEETLRLNSESLEEYAVADRNFTDTRIFNQQEYFTTN